ncbi:MAG: glycosyltransferase family 2 protein [Thermoanaerobaculia bacterium]
MSPLSGEMIPQFSVVVPFYNEAENAAVLIGEIDAAMARLGESWELLMVNDGSRDATGEILAAAAGAHPHYRYLRLPKNRGQAAALDAGMRRALGRFVVTMDGDGQNDPADIPALARLLDSADMVVGIRAGRRDSWLRRAMSKFANAIRGRLLDDRMRDSGCALKVFRREVVDVMLPLKTLYSFMPALARAGGFRLAELPVNHRPRLGGKSSYGFVAFLWKPAVDLVGIWWFRKRSFARRGVEVVELAKSKDSGSTGPPSSAPVP